MMRKVYGFLLVTTILVGCNDESILADKNLVIVTNEVILVNESGATLSGEFLSLGIEEIIDYGFSWKDGEFGFQNEHSLFNGKASLGEFQFLVCSGLVPQRRYTFKAYARTEDGLYFGVEKAFISQGSSEP